MNTTIAICPPVIQEILQGVKGGKEFQRFEDDFLSFPIVGNPLSNSTFMHAAHLYRSARKVEITVRSSMDCLIASIAIENNLPVWHRDRDFEALKLISDLETVA